MKQMRSAPIAQIHAFKTQCELTCHMRKYTTDQFYIPAGLRNIRIICYKTWSVPRISGMQIYLNPLHALQGLMKHQSSPINERGIRSEEHTSELQSRPHLVCRLLLEKKKKNHNII